MTDKQKYSPAINHHYIPAFHVGKWVHPQSKCLWITERVWNGRIHKQKKPSGRSVCFKKDLYTLQSELFGRSVDIPDEIEKKFQIIDDRAAVVMKRMNDGLIHDLSHNERIHWAGYIRSLMLRGPREIAKMEGSGDDIIEEFKAMKLMNDHLKKINIDAIINNQTRVAIVEFCHDKEWIHGLCNSRWDVVSAHDDCHFIMTESPIWSLENDSGLSLISAPISPNLLWLAASNRHNEEQWEELKNDIRIAYNIRKASDAEEYIISDEPLSDAGLIKYSKILDLLVKK